MGEELTSLVGATLDGRYSVVREIGRGAMGTVYEARHPLIGRRFAIKVLRRSCATAAQRERFLHEARAAGTISHPHVVQVQDFGFVPDGAPYLVMEYVDGVDLQACLQKQGSLPQEEALEIGAQVLSALEVIHGAGLVHRDIKPANIMLWRGGRPKVFAKLLDFGIARALNPAWQRTDLTRVDQVLGTPAYLSPEQAAGGPADPRWDLWATATILYEMLCGKLPFRLQSLEQVTDDILNCRLIPLRHRRADLPEWLYEVLDRALHARPEHRYRTATAFLQALEQKSARPEGKEGFDVRTAPFLRVELQAPPPALIAELLGDQRALPAEMPPPAGAEVEDGQWTGKLRAAETAERPAGRPTGPLPEPTPLQAVTGQIVTGSTLQHGTGPPPA
jgi:serine/threonine-protein kinase